jgi:hypothetical protein
MTLDDVLAALRDRGAAITVEAADRLRYHGPKLPADDPLRLGIVAHRAELVALFRPPPSFDPTRQVPPRPWRCVVRGCGETILDGELTLCLRHRKMADAGLPLASDAPVAVAVDHSAVASPQSALARNDQTTKVPSPPSAPPVVPTATAVPPPDWTPPPLAPTHHIARGFRPAAAPAETQAAEQDGEINPTSDLSPSEPDAPAVPSGGEPPHGDTDRTDRRARAARLWASETALRRQRKRKHIEDGLEERQPPEYRGRVFEYADRDGMEPSAFPPYRWGPQEGLSEEFLAFRAQTSPTFATHPQYYCPRCRWRYNARDGALCGPCLAQSQGDP